MGPTDFAAQVVGTTADVTWTATGGTLTAMSGLHVVYVPPPGSAMGTLTATAGGLTASVMISSSPKDLGAKGIPGLKGPVSVQYDAQDVPHIHCTQAVDCVAVQGYLQARDRWFPMDFLRHVAEGRLAELIGTSGLSSDLQLRTIFTTRGGNRLEDELRQALNADADPKTLNLLTAFTAGVNAYLSELKASHGALPGEYAQLPFPLTADDIAPWRIEDTLAVGRLNQFQLSETLNSELDNGTFLSTYGPAALGGKHPDAGKMAAWVRAPSPATERGHTLSAGPSQTAAPVSPTGSASHASVAPRSRRPARAFDISPWRNALAAAAARMAELHDRLRPADASVGSNNWVVSAAKSATGFAMVANDPHLSLQYPPLFHLAALTSSNPDDHLDITGGSFPGVAGALVGRGQHVGWGVTVVGYDVTDVYVETFPNLSNCPHGAQGVPCVTFKGSNVDVLPVPTTQAAHNQFLIRIAPGPSGLVDPTDPQVQTMHPGLPTVPPALLVVPKHGPILQVPPHLFDQGVGGPGISVRWTGQEGNTLDSKAFYGLATAADVDAAKEALKDYATGAQNFVLADDKGNIAYDPHALVPVRPWAVKGGPLMPWFPLPGDGSAEWGPGSGVDCATPPVTDARCWIADERLPQGKNPDKGYYFTANADPIGESDSGDPRPVDPNSSTEFPYLSFSWDDSSGFRATRIEQLLAGITATGKVSLDDMMKIQSDHVSRIGLAFAPIVAAVAASNPPGAPPEFAVAASMLAAWAASGADCPSGLTGTDPKLSAADTTAPVVASSSACFLFHAFIRTLVTNVFTDDLAFAHQGVNGLSAVKALLFLFTPDGAGSASFCDDVNPATGAPVNPAKPKTCGEQVVTALVQAFDTLSVAVGADPHSWVWGRVHTMQPVSLLALVTNGYEPGPYARPGGAFTVDVGSPSLSSSGLDFSFGSSGNVRHISLMDPSKAVVKMQLPGPERDGPALGTGPDLLGQWVKNSYFDYAAGDQINAVAVATQTFQSP
jgi:penicillin amidase